MSPCLEVDHLNILLSSVPTPEEMGMLKAYVGDKSELATVVRRRTSADSGLYQQRLSAGFWRSRADSGISGGFAWIWAHYAEFIAEIWGVCSGNA